MARFLPTTTSPLSGGSNERCYKCEGRGWCHDSSMDHDKVGGSLPKPLIVEEKTPPVREDVCLQVSDLEIFWIDMITWILDT